MSLSGSWTCYNCFNNNSSNKHTCSRCRSSKNRTQKHDWICPKCSCNNFASRNDCFKCHEVKIKEGDWICPKCSCNNFASRTDCFKCHQPKDGPVSTDTHTEHKYEARPGDWTCKSFTTDNKVCGYKNFGSRSVCAKCNNKPINTEQPKTGMCCICLEKPITTGISHQDSVHYCICETCGPLLNSKCPICRAIFDSRKDLKKIFLS